MGYINSAWREYYEEELCYDAISGEVMIKELVEAARKVERETLKQHGVCEKVPIEDCWGTSGKAPAGIKWVDANKGDEENLPSAGIGWWRRRSRRLVGRASSQRRRRWCRRRCCSHFWRVCRGCVWT